MKEIEHLGLGDFKFLNLGTDISFELLSMYDGHTLGYIVYKNFKKAELENNMFDDGEGFGGAFLPLVSVEEIDDIYQEVASEPSLDKEKIKGYLSNIGGDCHVNIKIISMDVEWEIDA